MRSGSYFKSDAGIDQRTRQPSEEFSIGGFLIRAEFLKEYTRYSITAEDKLLRTLISRPGAGDCAAALAEAEGPTHAQREALSASLAGPLMAQEQALTALFKSYKDSGHNSHRKRPALLPLHFHTAPRGERK